VPGRYSCDGRSGCELYGGTVSVFHIAGPSTIEISLEYEVAAGVTSRTGVETSADDKGILAGVGCSRLDSSLYVGKGICCEEIPETFCELKSFTCCTLGPFARRRLLNDVP
jgi:hypothetical protein